MFLTLLYGNFYVNNFVIFFTLFIFHNRLNVLSSFCRHVFIIYIFTTLSLLTPNKIITLCLGNMTAQSWTNFFNTSDIKKDDNLGGYYCIFAVAWCRLFLAFNCQFFEYPNSKNIILLHYIQGQGPSCHIAGHPCGLPTRASERTLVGLRRSWQQPLLVHHCQFCVIRTHRSSTFCINFLLFIMFFLVYKDIPETSRAT